MKYGFSVLFKGKESPIAKIFSADSNNKAHSLRTSIITSNKNILFVSKIEKADRIQLPAILNIQGLSSTSIYSSFKKMK